MFLSRIRSSLPWFIIIAAAFGVLSYGVIWAMNRQMDFYVNELAQSKALSLAHFISGDLKACENSIELLATNPIIRDSSSSEGMAYLKERSAQLEEFDMIFIGDTSGDYTTTQDKTGNIADRRYFRQVMEGHVVISNPVISKSTGQPQIVIAAPIIDSSGQVRGILAGTVTLARLTRTVNSEQLGDSGYAFMLDSDGMVIAHPEQEYLMSSRLVDRSDDALRVQISRMLGLETGTGLYVESGQSMIIGFAPLEAVPWSVAVTAPVKELYFDINLIWAVGLGIAIMGLGFILMLMYQALQEGEHEFREMLDGIFAGIVVYSPGMEILYANPTVMQILSELDSAASGLFSGELQWVNARGQDIGTADSPAWRAAASKEALHGEVAGIRENASGNVTWFLIDCVPVFDSENSLRQIIMTMVNITARKQLEEELRYYSTTDLLTGSHNRRSGLDILQKNLQLCWRQGMSLVLCFFDLNDLKSVNDRLGHGEGDNYLRLVSRCVNESIRSADTLVRMGGDEFLVILPECSAENAREVMKRVEEKLETANRSGAYAFKAGISYGLAQCPAGSACSSEDMINLADQDMYRHKMEMKNQAGCQPGE